MSVSRVYLSPGLFGFRRIGRSDYFCHVDRALGQRFRDAGREVAVHVVDVPPTASIRLRASVLAHDIERSADDAGPVHLLGHSTGGLDARLLVSPSMSLRLSVKPQASAAATWLARVRSVTTMNTPHYGTPLASFFATLSGQRLLRALSALTVAALQVSGPSLAISSALLLVLSELDQSLGIELSALDTVTDAFIRLLDDAASRELRAYLRLLRDDQGAVIQLSPEAMDLFQAGVEDRPGVRYQCTLSHAPFPAARHWLRSVLAPWANLSAPVFAMLQRLTAPKSATYPCKGPDTDEAIITRVLGEEAPAEANDGIVPLRSQLWGTPVWAGRGDHLDVLGHFAGGGHHDWLSSGSGFNEARFAALMDGIAAGMIAAE